MELGAQFGETTSVERAVAALRSGQAPAVVSEMLGVPLDGLGATLSFEIYRQCKRHVAPQAAVQYLQKSRALAA